MLRREATCDLVAVRTGDVAIEHDHVVLVDGELLERSVAVAGDVRRDRLEPEPVADRLGEEELVLDDQHAHAPQPRSPDISPVYRNARTPSQHARAWDGGMTVSAPSRSARTRTGRLVLAASVATAAVLVAAIVFLWSPVRALSAPFVPSAASGHIAGTASLDDDVPAITRLDPVLQSALREAAAAAAADGIAFEVTGGWRSRRVPAVASRRRHLDVRRRARRAAVRRDARPLAPRHRRGRRHRSRRRAVLAHRARRAVGNLPDLRERALALRSRNRAGRPVPGAASRRDGGVTRDGSRRTDPSWDGGVRCALGVPSRMEGVSS